MDTDSTNSTVSADETGPVVFDLGSDSVRVGYAYEDMPKEDVPATVGVCDGGTSDTRSSETADVRHDNHVNTNYYYAGIKDLYYPCDGLKVVKYMNNGMVENWDMFEKVLDYIYSRCLMTDSQYHPVFFTDPVLNEGSKREKLAELMFEKYEVPSIFLAKSPTLVALNTGCFTALIVDCGATHTTVIPIYHGRIMYNAIEKSQLGGDFFTLRCKQFLYEQKVEVTPQYMIAQKQRVKEKELAVWTRKTGLPIVDMSWHNYMGDSVVKEFKHSILQVSEYPLEDRMRSTLLTSHYEFPNGYNQQFGIERYKVPEILFNASIIGSSRLSLSNMIMSSVGKCNVNTRPLLYNNIIVTGGNSLIKGFIERLSRDLTASLTPNMRVKITASHRSDERRFGAWIGGSVLASSASTAPSWFSSEEYVEYGKSEINNRFF